jgi:hypothetical protein
MESIINAIRQFFVKLFGYVVVAALLILGWNFYKEQRESRTFVVSFNNIDGLSKGAPIYSKGVRVGKVIRIFPLGNTNDVGVKGLITYKNYPNPKAGVRAKIINNIEGGGGKVLEIGSLLDNSEEIQVRKEHISKGTDPQVLQHTMRLMQNFFQLSKDFANETLRALDSNQTQEYKDEIANGVKNTITSIEYGTLEQDLRNGVKRINKDIKDYEAKPDKGLEIQKAVQNQTKALRNTVESYGSLADVYKH